MLIQRRNTWKGHTAGGYLRKAYLRELPGGHIHITSTLLPQPEEEYNMTVEYGSLIIRHLGWPVVALNTSQKAIDQIVA